MGVRCNVVHGRRARTMPLEIGIDVDQNFGPSVVKNFSQDLYTDPLARLTCHWLRQSALQGRLLGAALQGRLQESPYVGFPLCGAPSSPDGLPKLPIIACGEPRPYSLALHARPEKRSHLRSRREAYEEK